MINLIYKQKSITDQINEEFKSRNYTLESPYIKINPYNFCPLSALVLFTTKNPCRISLYIEDDIVQDLKEYSRTHRLNVIGLKANFNNTIKITCTYKTYKTESFTFNLETSPLPEDFPKIKILKSEDNAILDGFYALSLTNTSGNRGKSHYISLIDSKGNIRWYYKGISNYLFKKLNNGNFLIDASYPSENLTKNTSPGFFEINLIGRIINYYPIDDGFYYEPTELPNGNFLVITQSSSNKRDLVIEIDRKSRQIINRWYFNEILDTKRPADLWLDDDPDDWIHINSVFYEEKDNSLIVCCKNQNAIVKINKNTAEIKWILAPHYEWRDSFKEYLLSPKGNNFEWSWGPHSPIITNDGSLFVFDNGNFRSNDMDDVVLAHNNYSRAVEYIIDEDAMEVEQIWQYGKESGNTLYSAQEGSIDILPNSNRLITFGSITKDIYGNPIDDVHNPRCKKEAYIIEVSNSQKPKVIFEAIIKNNIFNPEGYICFSSKKWYISR
ncbi:aryl-sulfate sulfotransferase [Clostridium sp. LP20]|uniref:aryl-sulfate sulfotransferase n=1 Tax=Clostridium sp. LP20 TaxID=3418665 RepID=UPI003EE4C621